MKHNKRKFIVIAVMVLLLGLVLAMSGTTFAKYITTKEVPATQATVAKWGMVITADVDDLFAYDYTLANDATYATKAASGTGVAVKGSSALVAPGTTGSMTVNVNGQAEVKSQISFANTANNLTVQLKTLSGDDNVNYEPIKWTVVSIAKASLNDAKPTETIICSNVSLATLEKNLEELVVTYDAGAYVDYTLTITWAWELETGSTDDQKAQNNNYDTILANAIAKGLTPSNNVTTFLVDDINTDNNESSGVKNSAGVDVAGTAVLSVSFGLKATVEQIQ